MRVLCLAACAFGVTLAFESDDALLLLQTRVRYQRANDSSDGTSPLKSRHDDKCMDYNFNNQNVYMHACHSGSNQQWYTVDEKLQTKYNNQCLDMATNGNVYMHSCHDGTNQQWYIEGESLRTRASPSKCLDYHTGNGNIYMHACHNGKNQDFYWAKPATPALADRVKSRHGGKCMDYNYDTNNIYFYTCHDGKNQKFYLDGTDLKSLYDDKCADYNYNNNNVYMHNCHNGKNQQWYFQDEQLKTNYDNKCLDLHTSNGNVYMHACHGGANQKFYLENSLEGLEHDETKDEIRAEEEEEKNCEAWCRSKKHSGKAWAGKKCAWSACSGCSEC